MRSSLILKIILSLTLFYSASVYADKDGEIHSVKVHLGGDPNTSVGAPGLDVQTNFVIPQTKEQVVGLINAIPKNAGEVVVEAAESNQKWADQVAADLVERGLDKKQVSIELIPDAMASDDGPSTFKLRKLKDFYVPATKGDIILAWITTGWRAVTAGGATFVLLGVSPKAIVYTAIVTSLTALFNFARPTLDNIFESNWLNQSNEKSEIKSTWRRRSFDLGTSEVLRGITGAVGDAQSVLTITGQIQLIQKFFTFSYFGSKYAATRAKVFSSAENKFANKWVNFDLFLGTAILDTLKQHQINLGIWRTFEIFHAQVNFTTVDALVIAAYFGGHLLLKYKTELVLNFARRQENSLNKMLAKREECNLELGLLQPVSEEAESSSMAAAVGD